MHKLNFYGKKLYPWFIFASVVLMVGGYVSIKTTDPKLGADIGGGIAVLLGGAILVLATLYAVISVFIKYVVSKLQNAKK